MYFLNIISLQNPDLLIYFTLLIPNDKVVCPLSELYIKKTVPSALFQSHHIHRLVIESLRTSGTTLYNFFMMVFYSSEGASQNCGYGLYMHGDVFRTRKFESINNLWFLAL